MDLDSLPAILEVKRTLGGERKEFRCRLVNRNQDRAIVLFVSEVPYQVGGLALPSGTVTLGHFWHGRDYNVYHWLTAQGRTLAHYFNLAAETVIDDTGIRWCDLTLDLLVCPGAAPVWLDEADLPGDLPASTRDRIESSRRNVVEQQAAVIRELEREADTLWRRLTGADRS
jgi:predicted RNA-binding protein associated with RNAse of E/G family